MVKIEWKTANGHGWCKGTLSDLSDKPAMQTIQDIKSGAIFDRIDADWQSNGNAVITITAYNGRRIIAKSTRALHV